MEAPLFSGTPLPRFHVRMLWTKVGVGTALLPACPIVGENEGGTVGHMDPPRVKRHTKQLAEGPT